MWSQSRVAVVVPAYREARIIGRMLRRLPSYVDAVFVVDDASPDDTSAVALAVGDPRVQALRHAVNQGVGAAIVTGYRAALSAQCDVVAVMAGDDQMHPDDLAHVIAPVAAGVADYVKGNRFVHPDARRMPLLRRLGGEVLSFSTRRATGLAVSDTQCGFTAISATTLRRLPLTELWPRYGYPNDLLGLLSSHAARVREVPVRPVYADEASGLRAFHVASILGVIARRYVREKRRANGR